MAEERLRDRCPTCDRLWYENAKPCAGAVVVEAGRVLLVRRAKDPFRGCWDLPGGFLEANEHPADGARREVLEETGLEVVLDRQLGMYVDTYRPGSDPMLWHHSLNIFFLARPVGGTLALSAETTEACWFKLAELPPLAEIAFENGRRALRDFLSLGQG
ncbi:MAG: nudF [Cyanobacteria bacterium RYN_339]|nr:nudF [Cyanobacteria bacterium RYN_339]